VRSITLLVAVLLSAGCAGAHPWSGRHLCELDRPDWSAPPGPGAWIQLLVRGWDRDTGRATTPAVDCTGRQVRWEAPALACEDTSTARALLPDRPLTEQDVVITPLEGDDRLVWVITNRYASGDGLGPAAVVTLKEHRLVARAVGMLRANVLRTKLRLERLGATEALVAEGETCASADPASCMRAARVMPLAGDRFVPLALVDASGGCSAPAWIQLGREESDRLPSGWRRRTRLDAAMTFGPAGFSVDEQVAVQDSDPRQPNAPARLFRKAESRFDVGMKGGQLVTSGPSLWSRIRAADR
jgi:hypothetical protein